MCGTGHFCHKKGDEVTVLLGAQRQNNVVTRYIVRHRRHLGCWRQQQRKLGQIFTFSGVQKDVTFSLLFPLSMT